MYLSLSIYIYIYIYINIYVFSLSISLSLYICVSPSEIPPPSPSPSASPRLAPRALRGSRRQTHRTSMMRGAGVGSLPSVSRSKTQILNFVFGD